MSLDIGALLATQRAIGVARADYDFVRDGGAVGPVPLQAEVIPAGSIILGTAIYTTVAFTYLDAGYHQVTVGGQYVCDPSPTLGYLIVHWGVGYVPVVTSVDRAIEATILDGDCTAGAFTVWVFYLPTTG